MLETISSLNNIIDLLDFSSVSTIYKSRGYDNNNMCIKSA